MRRGARWHSAQKRLLASLGQFDESVAACLEAELAARDIRDGLNEVFASC